MEDKLFLTPKQEKVFNFIRKRIGERLPPTIREIGGEFGFKSTGTVREYLEALMQKGLVRRMRNKSRAIELTDNNFGKIPIIGTIMAGKPNLAYENIEGYVDTNDLFLGRLGLDDVFALRVKGDSMIEAGIMPSDIAVLKKQKTAQDGEIIAALLDHNEVTLKKLRYKDNSYFLEAANPHYSPIKDTFSILGRLLTIIRKY